MHIVAFTQIWPAGVNCMCRFKQFEKVDHFAKKMVPLIQSFKKGCFSH